MRLAPALLAVSALSGCAAGRDYTRPDIALSAAYHAPVPIAAPAAQWWRRLGNPVLDTLVDTALAQNLDVAGAALLPRLDLAASADRTRQSLRTPVGAVANRLDLPHDYSLYTVGPQASWEHPHLALNGLLGFASIGSASLFTGAGLQASGGAGLRWRLFDFGRVDAEVAQARGQEAEALAQFRGAVLRATEEVETTITRLAETRTEITLREQQVTSLTRSRDQARQGYAGGALSLVDVLYADRALLEATDRLAAARAEAARASVAAVRALGGGWETRS